MFVSGMSLRYSAKPGANAQDLFTGKNFVIAAVLEENSIVLREFPSKIARTENNYRMLCIPS